MEFDDINRELRELCEQNCDEPVPDCLDLDLDAELVAAIKECMLEEELAALNGTAAPIDMPGWTVTRTAITTTKPDRAPLRLLTDTCDGIHPPRNMNYLRRKFPLSEFCTDVPRKHSAGPNPCGEVTLMSSRPCTLNHVTLDIDLTRSLKSITLSDIDIGVGPKKRKILSSR
jgi:hypothetical protein